MRCECCQEQEATIHLSQVSNGETRELHLCEACAEEHGLNVQNALSVPELLFGMSQARPDATAPTKACPQCHLRQTDYKKRGRLGCPACYETFSEELAPVLAAMHRGASEHKGKAPGASQAVAGREELQRRMQAALKAENYEEAARIRDLLREAGA